MIFLLVRLIIYVLGRKCNCKCRIHTVVHYRYYTFHKSRSARYDIKLVAISFSNLFKVRKIDMFVLGLLLKVRWVTSWIRTSSKSRRHLVRSFCTLLSVSLYYYQIRERSFRNSVQGYLQRDSSCNQNYESTIRLDWSRIRARVSKVCHCFFYFSKSLIKLARELALLRKLKHPNVVSFVACSLVPKKTCLAIEFCESGELRQYHIPSFLILTFDTALLLWELIKEKWASPLNWEFYWTLPAE